MNLIESHSDDDELCLLEVAEESIDDFVLLASFEQGLQHALDRFSAASDRDGMTLGTKKTEISSEPKSTYALQTSGNTLQQLEKLKYLSGVGGGGAGGTSAPTKVLIC